MFYKLSGRRGSNSRPIAWKAIALPTELLPLFSFTLRNSCLSQPEEWKLFGGGRRIRTFEAEATDLQSVPFDRSGTPPDLQLALFLSLLSESNQWPTDYKSVALPAELRRRALFNKTFCFKERLSLDSECKNLIFIWYSQVLFLIFFLLKEQSHFGTDFPDLMMQR